MHKLRYKLVFSVLLVILCVLASLAFVIGQIYENYYMNHVKERIEKETQLVAYMLEEEPLSRERAQTLAEKISNKLEARVTILFPDGEVIGESATDPEMMDNHLERPEIQGLLVGDEGTEIRFSHTVQDELLYYAVEIMEHDNVAGYVRLGLSTSDIHGMSGTIWTIILVCFTIAFFVMVYITYRIADQMIRPVENATNVAIELAEGNFKARTYESKHDEIGLLTKSINVLAYNLEQLTRRHQVQKEHMETLIENMGSGLLLIGMRGDISLINRTCDEIFGERTDVWLNELYHDVIKHKELIRVIQNIFITEQKQSKQVSFPVLYEMRHFDVHGAPIISNHGRLKGIALVLHDITELKKLEQIRKDFVANVSHELKTPVTSIKGFTETLLDGAMESEELRIKFLNIINKESDRLQRLIHDLLELSRIEKDVFQLHWQDVDLNNIIDDVAQLLREKAKEKQIDLQFVSEQHCEFEGDPERIKQIIINLIHNAITYTPNGGSINVKVNCTEEVVQLRVCDTGVGISQDVLPRIFERFYRVDPARSRHSGGTGLGLAIVKHLVEAHEGKINVESELGKGTTFSIIFNKKREKNS
ncbi:two-component system histidine kinase PnpS [Halalkalibacter sp. AB-rgal2]|uniref:two-component system histidine kinase PnpS n=1 Tax=Halalkalibacter sp. AB-rgal2 TaxID=3242695 RepID=UPI00359E3859